MAGKGPYELFKTDEDIENKGVSLNYGNFKIVVARAGGSNKKYLNLLEAKLRPYRRQIQTGTLDQETDVRVLAEVYAETVVLGWEGVTNEDGESIPFTKPNIIKLLTELPDLFADLRAQANNVSLFRSEDAREEDAKN